MRENEKEKAGRIFVGRKIKKKKRERESARKRGKSNLVTFCPISKILFHFYPFFFTFFSYFFQILGGMSPLPPPPRIRLLVYSITYIWFDGTVHISYPELSFLPFLRSFLPSFRFSQVRVIIIHRQKSQIFRHRKQQERKAKERKIRRKN